MSSESKGSIDQPLINPNWQPPPDPVFQYLLDEAVRGWVPVYFAAVPLVRLKRAAPTFHPENTPGGPDVVTQIMQRWRSGDFRNLWVYPKDDVFVVSDDYFTLAAAEIGTPDFMPCWVLGKITKGNAEQVQGPIPQDTVRDLLGLKPG